ncbi:hypothetical protein BFP76_07030 [Amylibacter kogurei]|uniref:Uncharacterized protein n=1 Tax=Paramylibacter kogurei TaxID=1889778 RepID=A0A2G5K5T4_9RHOB|nr:hypothetical protein BFP76_07030 [Amylibacter kogurei]
MHTDLLAQFHAIACAICAITFGPFNGVGIGNALKTHEKDQNEPVHENKVTYFCAKITCALDQTRATRNVSPWYQNIN